MTSQKYDVLKKYKTQCGFGQADGSRVSTYVETVQLNNQRKASRM